MKSIRSRLILLRNLERLGVFLTGAFIPKIFFPDGILLFLISIVIGLVCMSLYIVAKNNVLSEAAWIGDANIKVVYTMDINLIRFFFFKNGDYDKIVWMYMTDDFDSEVYEKFQTSIDLSKVRNDQMAMDIFAENFGPYIKRAEIHERGKKVKYKEFNNGTRTDPESSDSGD